MNSTIEILARINENSLKHPDEVFTRLYRYLLREDIYFIAYKNLYANSGAATKGIDDDTADGFSVEYIHSITESLRNGTYQPKPTRRTYIEKSNGKMRPISIPTFTDKLVQEVMRMILEAVYEPIFLDVSHGFRPNRSCHTALEQIKHEFTGVRWFVEGDIKGCFDNIDHETLVSIVNRKIKDARFIQLLWKILKAGYLEDWRYNKTFSGTPQGGIISPILANIYLHELDKKIMEIRKRFYKPRERAYTPEYSKLQHEIRAIKTKISRAEGEEKAELIRELKKVRKRQRSTPCVSQTDKRLSYVRYADDFIIGVVGSREDCEQIKQELTEYVAGKLKMELSAEKTLITHSNNKARFLGYDMRVRRDSKVKKTKAGRKVRTLSNKVERTVPIKDKIEKFLFSHGIVYLKNGKLTPCHRNRLLHLTDLEIVTAYGAEIRGICNYYNLASNYSDLHYFCYLMEYSCLKTLAAKHRTSLKKIRNKYANGKSWGVPYETQKGQKIAALPTQADCANVKNGTDTIPILTIQHLHSRTKFEDRLKARKCELCGSEDSEHYEIHHVNKVKNLKGKTLWEQIMIAKRRKTLVVCRECHKKIHGKQS